MKLEEALAQHLAEEKRPALRRAMRDWLPLFGAWCSHHGLGLAELTPAALERFHRDLLWQPNTRGHLYSTHTVQAVVARVRVFLRWAAGRGLVDPQLAVVLRVRKVQTLGPRLLSRAELTALRAAPDRTRPRGLRDALVLELVATTRLRLDVCLGLRLDQLPGLELEPAVRSLLELYLTQGRRHDGPLVLGSAKGPGLTVHSLRCLVKRTAAAAGLSQPVTPRLLRQSYQAQLERAATARLPRREAE